MLLELIATFSIGFGVAGIALLITRLSGGRLPRWLMPVAAGVAMIAFTIWSEYAWFNRTSGNLPEGLVIVWANESRQVYRPWTYVVPMKDRFTAVDVTNVRTNDAHPDQRLADVYLFGRWMATRNIKVIIDCAGQRRADLMEGVSIDDTGAVNDDAWIALESDDPVMRALCKSGG